ncbi:hypothetical protein AK88_00983 [Plasmodium fragile]|uniref:Uncharacterized protein n=1 Tax=Plasmodium fragile TaxID=5857 RepID=A0A0D9QTV6_PLAFR|nr:uncharacterized protein AK88_00983 [Plasmodium fragile]KJP89321.1 hypothetical protein AK88_00983 [Plasmodium fragile]
MKEYSIEHNEDKGEVTKCESEYSALLECLDTFDRFDFREGDIPSAMAITIATVGSLLKLGKMPKRIEDIPRVL